MVAVPHNLVAAVAWLYLTIRVIASPVIALLLVLEYPLDSLMLSIHPSHHKQLFLVVVLLVFGAGVASGAVLYLNSMAQHRDLATGKFFTPATQRSSSQQPHLMQPTPSQQQAIELTAVESILSTAPAGSQVSASVIQFTGTRALGFVHYQSGSPDIHFIAAKDTVGNWHIIKTDYKLDSHGPGPAKMVRTGHITSL